MDPAGEAAPFNRRLFGGVLAAAALVALTGTPVAAFDWGDDIQLSAEQLPYGSRVVATGHQSAVVTWFGSSPAGFGLQMRRTDDGGQTWTRPQLLAGKNAPGYVITGLGRFVDLVWDELQRCPSTRTGRSYQVLYRRSIDGGTTWTDAVSLTPSCTDIADQTLARAADGQVTVAYTVRYGGRVLTRTSLDGGRSFRPAVRVGRSAYCGGDTGGGRTGPDPCTGSPAVAIGAGVTYLAHTGATNRGGSLALHVSHDRGASWSPSTQLARVHGPFSIVAQDKNALVGYDDWRDHAAKFRRTADGGKTWEPEQQIQIGALVDPALPRPSDPREGVLQGPPFTADLRFDHAEGVVIATFNSGVPGDGPVWQKQSTDFGRTWSAAARVSVDHADGFDAPSSGGVAVMTHAIAVYDDAYVHGVWVRIQRDTPRSRALKL